TTLRSGAEIRRPFPRGYDENMRRPFSTLSRLDASSLAAIGLIVLVLLIIFARLLGSAAFLWVALVGAPFLLGYARLGTRAFLLLGALLVGSGIGILFEANLAWDGAYLTSVGAALAAAEALSPTPARLALLIGIILAAIGVGMGLVAAGTGPLIAFVALLLLATALFLRRGQRR